MMKEKRAFSFGTAILVCSLSLCQISEPYGELLFEDTISLEPLHEWLTIPTQEESIWQIGQANKQFLDSSLTGGSVLITDTVASYPISTDEYFLLSIPLKENWYSWAEGILSFYHKYQTDSLSDGGLIEVSYEGGEKWLNVLYDLSIENLPHIGLYSESDTITGGLPAFTGTVNDWIYTEIHWVWYALSKTSGADISGLPILRFRFVSDSIDTGKDGWLISNIVFRGYDVSGSLENRFKRSAEIFPNPCKNYLNVSSLKDSGASNIRLYSIDGKLLIDSELSDLEAIDVSDLTKGLYFYAVFKENTLMESGKLVKN